NAAVYHAPRVDAGGSTGEAEGGNAIVVVAGKGDRVHEPGDGDGLLGRPAHEAHDGGRGGHGEAAEAGRLRDGAVAQIGIGVGRPVAGKVETVGDERGRGGPRIARATHAHADLDPVARHGRHHRRALDAVRSVHGGLRGGHGEVEIEVIVDLEE